MMLVNSTVLDTAADALRERGRLWPLRCGITVSAEQMDTAARLLREAEPSQITKATGTRSGAVNFDPQERPGFIDPEQQEDAKTLTFAVGILPTATYRIARDGSYEVAS